VAEARKDTPELYIYDINMKAFPFHYYVTQFRSEKKGGTLLDIYYGLPTSELIFKQETPTSYKATVENGFALFDTLWNVKGRIRNRVVLNSKGRPDQRAGSIHVDKLSMLLRGGQRAILSVQAKDVNSGRVEAYQQKLEVAKFDSVTLAMSDLVLAGSIAKADSTSEGKFVRNGLVILPMASRSFRRGQKIHVYFEVYNLGRGKTYGETEYEVEHAIRQGGKFSRGTIIGTIGRFLGGSTQSVGVTRIIKGLRSSEFQDFTLDSSTMPSGAYTLIITVRDLKSGNSVTKEQPIWIGT